MRMPTHHYASCGEGDPLIRNDRKRAAVKSDGRVGRKARGAPCSPRPASRCFPGCLTGSASGRAVLCLVLPFLALTVAFVGFRCIVSYKMAVAWREARRFPQTDLTGGRVTIDPLQGARLEFLFDAVDSEGGVPLAIVHGVEITARDMDREAELMARLMPGTYVQSVEYAPGVVTYFESLDNQLDALCLRLRNHRVFGKAKEVDVMGHSSGAILARAVAQNARGCFGRQNIRVRHYVGLAGPQQGVVAAVPGSRGESTAKSRFIDSLFVFLARKRFVEKLVVSTAAYLYDPRVSVDDVRRNFGPASLLGRLNQGSLLPAEDRLRNLSASSLSPIGSSNTLVGAEGVSGNVLLVASLQDEVVRPTETAFFSLAVGLKDWSDVFGSHSMESRRNLSSLRALCDTDLWSRDTIGLRKLWDKGRVFVYRSPTHHGPLPEQDYKRVVAPFLLGEIMPPRERASSNAVFDDNVRAAKVVVERIGANQEVEMQVLSLDP